MEHHFIIALQKCSTRTEAIELLATLDYEKKLIKLKANNLMASNKPSPALDKMLQAFRKQVNKLTQIHNIIKLKIKELGDQEKAARRLTCRMKYSYGDQFVHAAAGVLNKQTFDKIKAIALANDKNTRSKKPA